MMFSFSHRKKRRMIEKPIGLRFFVEFYKNLKRIMILVRIGTYLWKMRFGRGKMAYIEVKNLQKSFGTVHAVRGISFTVNKGEIFTIIGPNGAGKTTTLEMMEGLLTPDRGEIKIGGRTWKRQGSELRRMIGVQPQSNALFDLLTPEENLDLFASFYQFSRPVEEILQIVNLSDHRKRQVKKLSGGQKQRLAIGIAMISDPDIIFLDEPTTRLDPQARRNIWDIILSLKQLGKTIILTTHYMEEAEKLSDRVCIVDQGEIIALDSPKNLIGNLSREREFQITFFTEEEAKKAAKYSHERKDFSTRQEGKTVYFYCQNTEEGLYEMIRWAREQDQKIDQISLREISLEDVFISYTGKEWRD
mgnify:CR=1 FL=1